MSEAITAKKLETVIQVVFPKCKIAHDLAFEVSQLCDSFYINTDKRIAMFLAQCGHESAGFTRFEENLNYSAEGLRRVFPKYFRDVSPDDYARQPEKIANRVYSNRMGNGSEETGDGWKFRGRGIIQLTGRKNYSMAASATQMNLLEDPDILKTNVKAMVISAMTFWNSNALNNYADHSDVKGATKKINGGYNGLDVREQLYSILLNKLKA